MAWEPTVGEKCVCVDADFGPTAQLSAGLPVEGRIYTITAVRRISRRQDCGFGYIATDDFLSLLFAELGAGEGFDADNFQPLPKRKTDISCFTNILNGIHTPSDLVDA